MLAGPRERLRESIADDGGMFPIKGVPLDRQDRKALDAFLQRFQQVYDILVRKAMPRALAYLTANERALPFRDMLDALDRLELIESADAWEELNQLRNRLVHEYAWTMKLALTN